jgi:uncharacterized protein YkwD
MPFQGMRFLVVLAVALAAVHTSAAAAPAVAPTKIERRAALEAEIVREMNQIRVSRGIRPLRAAPSLRTAARAHSRAMLELGFFGHDSADGTAFSDRIKRYYTNRGWETWSVGEALLASEGRRIEAKAIVKVWLDSPPHREVILSSAWRDAGIGAVYTSTAPAEYGGSEAVVVTADFGLRNGKTAGS